MHLEQPMNSYDRNLSTWKALIPSRLFLWYTLTASFLGEGQGKEVTVQRIQDLLASPCLRKAVIHGQCLTVTLSLHNQ